MNISTRLLHQISYRLSRYGQQRFMRASHALKAAQLARFQNIMAVVSGSDSGYQRGLTLATSVEEFRQRVPLSDYEDWQNAINRQRSSGEFILTTETCQRYQPTSGSTAQIKWIPYTPEFLRELDQAINPWMADLYSRYPAIRKGRHYWSLSWVPGELRSVANSVNDDLQLLPWWKRLFMNRTMAVPQAVSLAPSSELSLFASLCYLCAARDLTLMSVWSPTFLLSLLEQLGQQRMAVAQVLEQGRWGEQQTSLGHLSAPRNRINAALLRNWNGRINATITRKLWPELALISAWDTSSSEPWARQLQQLFSHSDFQGKGLWATEGVVTIPYGQQYPLALESHFYEFENLANKQILFSWELEPGMQVRPVITTASGLLRYRTKDRLLVDGFINQCPTLRFISRLSGTDMVGEKMSPQAVLNIFSTLTAALPLQPVSLLAVPAEQGNHRPTYVLLASGGQELQTETQQRLEALLQEHFHYKLARELGQLNPARVIISDNAMATYTHLRLQCGAVAGNIKVEPLLLCPAASELLNTLPEDSPAESGAIA
ncbi:GH3 family domain-containing protein [Thalassolituus sp. UBA2009]|uniref:GH3 family domain-containing protein n=1 Tax=Thalassolituus sp. UBA2009 TaxID=1947658 RepID=UPI00257C2EE3|nr:GH3 auxin-responsive promoter family protein [Thalassolituus sp. UBA2009]